MGKLRSWSSNNEKKTIYFDSLCIFSFVVFVVAAAAAVTFTCINDNEVIVSENMSKHLSFHWTVSCVCKRFFFVVFIVFSVIVFYRKSYFYIAHRISSTRLYIDIENSNNKKSEAEKLWYLVSSVQTCANMKQTEKTDHLKRGKNVQSLNSMCYMWVVKWC